MGLPTSGAISLNQMHTEVGGTSSTQVSLNDSDIRALIGKSSGAQMSFNEWHGASASLDTQTVTIGAAVDGNWVIYYGYMSFLTAGGSISDGTFNVKSGATIYGIYRTAPSSGTDYFYFHINGNHANSGWTTLTANGNSFSRSSAVYTYLSSTGKTYWRWTQSGGTEPAPFSTVNASNDVVFT
jgi:hypothetical protein